MQLDAQSQDQPGNASVNRSSHTFNQRSGNTPLRVLSEADWQFWRNNGYVIIRQAVSPEQVRRTVDFIWQFQEMNPDDQETWYHNPANEIRMTELRNSGMVEVYNHQCLWNNRQTPRIYESFTDIWGRDDLWVTIDRANLNPPVRPGNEFSGFIHWDVDTSIVPRPVNVQGVLALNNQTDLNMGGFQCIPELYRNFESWVTAQPDDRDPFRPHIDGFELTKVPLEAGDLLIWNSMLPHGIRPNYSNRPRLAQYISMVPAEPHNQELLNWRIQSWRDRVAPEGYPFPGDPRNWEQTRYGRAELSELGQKLLGLDPWE